MVSFMEALQNPKSVISVIGSHAGESVCAILDRKKADIHQAGIAFWVVQSRKARPSQVRSICVPVTAYTLFIEPAMKGGARPTVRESIAREYSVDKKSWRPFSGELTPVTGKMDSRTSALVFDKIETDLDETIDLWDYSDAFDTHHPLRFILGCSTVCTIKKDASDHPNRMKSRHRKLVALARLADPYCVWVR